MRNRHRLVFDVVKPLKKIVVFHLKCDKTAHISVVIESMKISQSFKVKLQYN